MIIKKTVYSIFIIHTLYCISSFGYERAYKPVQSTVQKSPGSLSVNPGTPTTTGDTTSNTTTFTLNSGGTTQTKTVTGFYDLPANTFSFTGQDGRSMTYTYDPTTDTYTYTDQNGQSLSKTYNTEGGYVVYSTNPSEITETTSGNEASITGALGYSITGAYDPTNETMTVTGPLGNQTVGYVNPSTDTLTYTGSQGNLIVTYDPSTNTSSYQIVGNSGLTLQGGTAVYDPTSQTYIYTPPERSVVATTSPSNPSETIYTTSNGQVLFTQTMDTADSTLTYQGIQGGELTSQFTTSGPDITYNYTYTNPEGQTETATQFFNGASTTTTGPQGATITRGNGTISWD